ncbi:MAG: hypothetical protein ACOCVF_00865 [bacterium]
MYKLYLLIFSTVLFFSYNGYVLIKHGFLPSISASYYELNKKIQPIFTFFIWGFIFPVMVVGETGFMFMAGALIAFVGASPNFEERDKNGGFYEKSLEGEVHAVGAMGGILLALTSLIVNFNLYLPVIAFIFIIISFKLLKIRNVIYWSEIVAFLTVLGSLYYIILS